MDKVAVIFLHPACNMSCTFCITEDNFDVMSQKQAIVLLGQLKQEGFQSIVFGGGEPFAWPGDLVGLTREAKRLGLLVQIGTNAVDLPVGYERIASIDRFVLPLESTDSAAHNKMRLFKGKHHQLILSCLQKLREAGKSVTISTIITKVNLNGLRNLAQFLKELNQPEGFIHAWHLYKFLPFGRGGEMNAETLKITDEEYTKACDAAEAVAHAFKIFRRKDMYHSKTVDFLWVERGRLQRAGTSLGAEVLKKITVPFV